MPAFADSNSVPPGGLALGDLPRRSGHRLDAQISGSGRRARRQSPAPQPGDHRAGEGRSTESLVFPHGAVDPLALQEQLNVSTRDSTDSC